MRARRGMNSHRVTVQSVAASAAATLALAGSQGRVWSIALTPTTAATCTWLVSSGGTNIWIMYAPATVGAESTVHFPNGLAFTNGLALTEVQGVGILNIAWSLDAGATI